eukprot:jgi/Chlat1/5425/Chrsp35S08990
MTQLGAQVALLLLLLAHLNISQSAARMTCKRFLLLLRLLLLDLLFLIGWLSSLLHKVDASAFNPASDMPEHIWWAPPSLSLTFPQPEHGELAAAVEYLRQHGATVEAAQLDRNSVRVRGHAVHVGVVLTAKLSLSRASLCAHPT